MSKLIDDPTWADFWTAQADALCMRVAEMFEPKVEPRASEWIGENVQIDGVTEGSYGPYDLERRPWWINVLDNLNDWACRFVNLMMPPQVGKTLSLIAALIYCQSEIPKPSMFTTPEATSGVELRDRTYVNALASPSTEWLVPSESTWNRREMMLGGSVCYLAWPGAKQTLRGRRAAKVFCMEVDVYPEDNKAGDPVASAEQRVKSFTRWQIWCESSPIPNKSRIQKRFNLSLRHWWYCPCPHCGHWQTLRFFTIKEGEKKGCGGIVGYRDDAGQMRSPEEARKHAHYKCEKGCRIEQHHKQAMLIKGKWLCEGQHIDSKGEVYGEPVKDRRHVGYHLWAIFSETVTLGDLAASYVEAYINGTMADFWQNTLGKSYSTQRERPKWKELGTHNAGRLPRRIVPKEAWFLTCGVDVQPDRIRFVVRAWGDRGTSWLIDWGMVERTPGDHGELIKSDLRAVEELITETTYEVEGDEVNPLGQRRLWVHLTGIDTGHRQADVFELVQKYEEKKNIRGVRGDHHVNRGERWRESQITENARTKQAYAKPRSEWQANVDWFKDDIAERMNANIRMPGAFILPSDIMDYGRDYLVQVVNEAPDKDGRWVPVQESIGWDYWDCEVYARVVAEMVVVELFENAGWDASKWTMLGQAPQTDSEGHTARLAI